MSVVVFPVPGGPWMMASSLCASEKEIASLCDASSESL